MWIRKLFKRNGRQNSGRGAEEAERLAEVNRVLQETASRLERLEAELLKASSGYRQWLIEKNPDILPELIGGSSPEEMDRSLVAARDLTEKIKKKLEEEGRKEQSPAGAPVRSPPDVDGLSPSEKIREGLERLRN
jgi:hypothetical protein